MIKKISLFFLISILSFCSSGCIVKTRSLESLGLASAIGIDQGKGEKLTGITVLHHFGTRPEDVAQQLTSTAYTETGLSKFMNLETSDRIVSGQLRIAIYGKQLAKKHRITELAEGLKRDPATQATMYLAISKTKAKDILHQAKEKEHSKNLGMYLYKMLSQSITEEEVISCTLQEYLRDYYQVGKDSVLPLLEKRRDFVLIDGAALMHNGKFVIDITAQENFYVKALREGYKENGELDIQLPFSTFKSMYHGKEKSKSMYVNLKNIKLKRDIRLVDPKIPSYRIDMDVMGTIAALSKSVDLGKSNAYSIFEKEISKEIKKESEKMLEKLKKNSVDPIGFGQTYDTSIRQMQLTDKKWYGDLYKKAKFQVNVKTTITRSGVIN